MKVALYARISTSLEKQDPEMQLRELRAYCGQRNFEIFNEYVDIVSGTKDKRPALDQLMKDAMRKRFSGVLVYRFDRFARSTRFLIESLANFEAWDIDFISLHEGIDTSTPTGKLVFTMIAGLAEFERSLIVERVKSGLDNARANGKRLGRPQVTVNVQEAKGMRAGGRSLRQIAQALGISLGKVHALLRAAA